MTATLMLGQRLCYLAVSQPMAHPCETTARLHAAYRPDPRKAVVLGLACWLGFALLAWAVDSGHAEAIDRSGLLFWRDGSFRPLGPSWLLEAVRDVTALGGPLLRSLLVLAALTALLFIRLRREAALLAMIVVSGWLVEWTIKLLVGRARPQIVPHLTEAGGASFPSGHSFNAALIYLAMALTFAALSPRASVRTVLVAGAVVLSLAIAWSRVWLGVHWPSDAMAGWFGGAGWALLANALLYRPAKAAGLSGSGA